MTWHLGVLDFPISLPLIVLHPGLSLVDFEDIISNAPNDIYRGISYYYLRGCPMYTRKWSNESRENLNTNILTQLSTWIVFLPVCQLSKSWQDKAFSFTETCFIFTLIFFQFNTGYTTIKILSLSLIKC